MDVASLTVKVVNEGLDETVKGLGDLGKEAGKTEKASDKLSNSFKKIQDDVKKNTGLSRELKDAVAQLNGAYLDSEGRLHGADGKYLKMTDSMKKAINEVDGLKDALKKQGEEAEKTGRSFDKLKGAVTGFNESVAGLRNAGLVMAGALTGVLYKSVNAAKDFESAMADVKKVVDFDTPDGLENMRDELLEMSRQIPITAEGFAQIAAAAGQSGIAANEIAAFAEAAAKMGTAFDISADQAGQAMAEMRVAFKMSQDEVGGLVDQINYLGDSTPNSAAKILEIVQRIGPLGEIAGVSADQIAALGASITSLEPEVVATGLKNMMLRMTAGAAATKPMKAAWHDLGFTAQEVALGMQEDSEAMVNAVLSAVKKLPKEEQAAYINTLFGQEAIGVISQLVTNGELLEQNMMAIGDATKYAGSAQKEFEARSATTENQMILMGNNINTAWIAIGDAVLPVLNDIIEAVIPVVESMADWAKENPELVQGIIIVTGAISGLLLGVTGLGLAISGAMSIFSGLAAVGGVLATALGFVSLPMIAIVAAIAGVIGAGYMLYKHWDEIKAFASETWDSVKNSASEAWEGVTSSISGLVDDTVASFQDLGNSISDTWSNIKSSTSQNWESIKSTMVSGAQSAIDAAKSAFAGLPAPIQNVLTIVYNVVKTQLDLVRNIFSTVLNMIKAAVRGDMQGVVNAFKTGMSNAWNIIKGGATNIVNAMKDLGARLFKAGVDAVQGLINGIKSKIAGVKSAASELGQAAWGGVKSFLQIRSPSRKMAELGKNTAEGLAKGIKDNKKKPASEAQKMAEQAVKAVKDTIANLKKEIALFGNDDPLAEINYDIGVGKYKGVANSDLEELKALKATRHELDEAKKVAEEFSRANESVINSIKDINRQLSLLDGSDAVSTLMYDLAYTEKYANATAENIQKLIDKTTELELMRAQGAANDAFYNMTDSMQSDSPMGKLIAERDERLAILEQARMMEVISAQQHADTLLAIDQAYMDGKRDLLLNQSQDLFSGLSGLAKSFAGEQSGVYRALFAIEKGFAIAQSAIAIQQSVAKAMAVGFPANIPLIGQAIAQGGQIMSSIKSVAMPVGQAHDGIMSVPKSGTWNLEKGERVLPAHTAKAMDKKLEQGGGTTVNIYNNAAGVEVEQKINDDGSIDVKIEKRIKQSWNNLQNPNSHESKMLGRNVQAPRRR